MILVFGMPRSGTSWIGKIFDSHPDTLYRHEPDSSCKSRNIPITPALESLDDLRPDLEEYIRAILALRSASVSAKLPILAKSYYPAPIYLLRKYSAIGARIWSRYLHEIQVPEFIAASERKRIRLVWKSIESIGRLGLIVRILEDCRALLIIRHPCGQIASVLRGEAGGQFGDPNPSSEDYGIFDALLATPQARVHGLSGSALHAMQPVERLAWRWVLFNEKALLETAGLANCMTVRYEDLCADPSGVTRAMFAFSGLDWGEATHQFLEQSIGAEKRGYYGLVKDPRRSARKWREQLSPEDIGRITAIASRSRVGRWLLQEAGENPEPRPGAHIA